MDNQQEPSVSLTKKRQRKTFLRRLALLFLIPLLLFLMLLSFLLFTHPGLKTIAWGAQKALPQLSIGNSKGSLLPEFTLSDVHYSEPDLFDFDASMLHFELTLSCLFIPSICIDEVSLDGVNFNLPTLPDNQEVEDEDDLQEQIDHLITTPLPITLKQLSLTNININVLDYEVSWDRFQSGAEFNQSNLTIMPILWESVTLSLPDSVSQNTEAKTSSSDDSMSRTKASEPLVLPAVFIPLNINIEKFELNHFSLVQEPIAKINQLIVKATARENAINVKTLALDSPTANVQLSGDINLKEDYPLNLESVVEIKETELKGHKITMNAKGSVGDLESQLNLSGGLRSQISIFAQPLDQAFPFKVTVSNTDLYWPLVGDKNMTIETSHIGVQGDLDDYDFDGLLNINGGSAPKTSLDFKGEGDINHVELETLFIETLGGSISGKASANWASLLNWESTIQLKNIQPHLKWPQIKGNLSGNMVTSGQLTEQSGWDITFSQLDMMGDFLSYPLMLKGAFNAKDIDGKGNIEVTLPKFNLSHGTNMIKAEGTLNKEWNLDLSLDIPDLSHSIPKINGEKINGKVEGVILFTGKQNNPKINLDVTASSIEFKNDFLLKKLNLKGYIRPLPIVESELDIELLDGIYQKEKLNKLSVSFKGDERSHQILIDMDSERVISHVLFDAGFDRQKGWQAKVSEASLDTPLGPWSLDQTPLLSYDINKQHLFIQAHCWKQEKTEICVDKDLNMSERFGLVDLSIKHFKLNSINHFLPEKTTMDGEVDIDTVAKWSKGSEPYVNFIVTTPQGKLQQIGDRGILNIGWDKIAFESEMKQGNLLTDWEIKLTDNGELKGELLIEHLTGNKTIKGYSKIHQFSLSMLASMFGKESQLNGMVNSNIKFSGPIEKPMLIGSLDTKNIEMEAEGAPFDISQGDINISLDGYSGKLNSKINTEHGDLSLNGFASWEELSNWEVGIDIFGDELGIKQLPMIDMKIQPDIQIRMTPELAKVSGQLSIPWGRIVIEELPESAVSVSKDEVILDDNLQPPKKSTSLPMNIEVALHISIGDDVQYKALGLTGGLIGDLKVVQKDKGPIINGEINIQEGSYRSFGQSLEISKGKILFNGPADQPYLDIEAIRNPNNTQDDVIVGIKATGPADTPKVEIFSSPSMPQMNALSYLLRGEDLDNASGGNTMTTALIGLTLAQGSDVVGNIGKVVGVDDLQLDTAGSGDESQVTISGYVTPDLQVKYGVGVFDSIGELTLRYRIITDLYIEAVSGVDNAVDLIYRFEFD